MSMGRGKTFFWAMLLLAALSAHPVSANDMLNVEMALAADAETEAMIISETESMGVLLDAEESGDVEVNVAETDLAETGTAVLNASQTEESWAEESQTEEMQTQESQTEESQAFISDIEEVDSVDASDSDIPGADEINAIAIDQEASDENVNAVDEEELSVLHSGTSGDLNWSISSDYVLTISGSGDYEYDLGKQEWAEYADEIKTAIVDVTNITSMYGMFDGCTKLESVDFGDSDFSKVTNMSDMFSMCSSLLSVDLSGFDTSSIMFLKSLCK